MTAEELDNLLLDYAPLQLERAQIGGIMAAWAAEEKAIPDIKGIAGNLMNQYRNQLKQIDRKIAAIEKLVNSCPDDTLRDILHDRYLDNLTWEAVADKVGYSPHHIFRLKRAALRLLLKG